MNDIELYERIKDALITLTIDGIERRGSLGYTSEGISFNYNKGFWAKYGIITKKGRSHFEKYPQKLTDLIDLIGDDEILGYRECQPLTKSEQFPPTFALTRRQNGGIRFWTRYRTNWYCENLAPSGEQIRMWAALFNLDPKSLQRFPATRNRQPRQLS